MPAPSATVTPRMRSISSSVCRRVSSPRTATSEPPRRTRRNRQLTTAAPTTAPAASSTSATGHREHGADGPVQRRAVDVGQQPAGQLVEEPRQRAHGGDRDGEVAADQRCVEQPPVVEAGELLLGLRLGLGRGAVGVVRRRCRDAGRAVVSSRRPQPLALGAGDAVDQQFLVLAAAPALLDPRRRRRSARGPGPSSRCSGGASTSTPRIRSWARCAPSGPAARG